MYENISLETYRMTGSLELKVKQIKGDSVIKVKELVTFTEVLWFLLFANCKMTGLIALNKLFFQFSLQEYWDVAPTKKMN